MSERQYAVGLAGVLRALTGGMAWLGRGDFGQMRYPDC